MDVIQTILDRRNIRAFSDKPVEQEKLEKLMECAVHAPNAFGAESWYFAVITDPELLEEFRVEMREELINSHAPEAVRNIAKNDPSFNPYYGAPVLIACCGITDFPFKSVDAGMAGENIHIAAKALGLGTCTLGSMPDVSDELKSKVVPPHCTLLYGLAVGYPAENDGSRYKERDMSKVVYFK